MCCRGKCGSNGERSGARTLELECRREREEKKYIYITQRKGKRKGERGKKKKQCGSETEIPWDAEGGARKAALQEK